MNFSNTVKLRGVIAKCKALTLSLNSRLLGPLLLLVACKDGNGDPIPDSPWGIPLLGDGDGEILFPVGKKMGGNLSPLGLVGTGMVLHPPYPIPHPHPVKEYTPYASCKV